MPRQLADGTKIVLAANSERAECYHEFADGFPGTLCNRPNGKYDRLSLDDAEDRGLRKCHTCFGGGAFRGHTETLRRGVPDGTPSEAEREHFQEWTCPFCGQNLTATRRPAHIRGCSAMKEALS